MANAAGEHERVWLVTGTSTGIGRALVREVLERGERVAATSRDPNSLQGLAVQFGDALLPLAVDLGSAADVQTAVATTIERLGRLDVLVYNAGYGLLGAVEELSEGEWRAQFDVNFFGAARAVRAVVPHMRAARRGEIMLLSSSGRWIQNPLAAAYLSSKHALVGLVDALSPELAPFGVRARLVTPGTFRTEFAGSSLRVCDGSVAAYAGQRSGLLDGMQKLNGRQVGDPARAARALFEAASDPPGWTDGIVLGSDAIEQAQSRLARERDHLADVVERARSTDAEVSPHP